MDLLLVRDKGCASGIFGKIYAVDDGHFCVTLEHSYDGLAKIPSGVYTCKRGCHTLPGRSAGFITFEVMGVIGHAGILFHWGNYNRDSSGCILIGEDHVDDMITNSRKTFRKLMLAQEGIDEFKLTVR